MSLKNKTLGFLLLLSLFHNVFIFSNTLNYRLSLRDDPSTSVVIGWEQDGGSNPQVYYGTIDEGQNWMLYPNTHGVDRSVSASGMDNKFARLTGLTPNTEYYFVIKDSDGVSPRFWFKTTPMGNSIPLSVIAGGDSRSDIDDSGRENANALVAKLRPDLVMFGGDYTWLNTSLEWQEWMNDWQLTISTDGRMVPVLWERGNHELSSGTVYDLFDIPSSSSDEYYAITVGGDFVRFYTLNTEISVAGNQKTWLENDLITNHDNHDWNIAQYHTCMRPHTQDKSNGDAQYNAWAQLFHDYRVQLVVESDAHDVKTTFPVKPSTGPDSEDGFELDSISGSVYIGEGCWGAPLRTNNWDKSWTRNSGSFNSFHWIKITKDTIEIRTVGTDNASSVGSVTDNDRFTPPANIDIWNPSNGSVVYIANQKYIDRPLVDITYPVHQQFFSQPQTVTISADANATNGGSIQEVRFYINDSYIGNDVTAPYDFVWGIPSDGDYVITAWAVDNEGWNNVSDEVRVFAGDIDITASLISDDDDAEEYKSDGSVDLNSSDIELTVEDLPWPLDNENQWIGLRFSGLQIPQGATIQNAYLQFTADEDQDDAANITIYGEASGDALAFSGNDYNLSNRTLTSSSVGWSLASWYQEDSGFDQQSPDLTSIVSEITSRTDWQIGNALAFLIEGNGTRSAYSKDESTSKSAKLHVTFSHSSPVFQVLDETENQFIIYPNPAQNEFIVNSYNSTSKIEEVSIFDSQGKLVFSEEFTGLTKVHVSTVNLKTGFYIVKIGSQIQKLIIKN